MISDRQLASWIHWQRQTCTDPRRRSLLEAISGWSWNAREDVWEKSFLQLKKYGVRLDRKFEIPGGFNLGGWMYAQRLNCKDPERRKKLETIPGWSWNMNEIKWEEGFLQLKKYGIVPSHFKTPEGYRLGGWINDQRSKCKDPERRKRLESIKDWTWNAKKTAWEEGFLQLKKYGIVPAHFKTPEGYRLGMWIYDQRTKCCKDPERRKRLESIKDWTWSRVEFKDSQPKSKVRRK
jgi:hypothetical protein